MKSRYLPAFAATRGRFSKVTILGKFECEGSIILRDTEVSTDLIVNNAVLRNPEKRAFIGTRLSVGGNLTANESNFVGSVDLTDAKVRGDIKMMESTIQGVSLKIFSHGSPRDSASGREWRGIGLNLDGADIMGEVDFRGSKFSETLRMEHASVGRTVLLDGCELNGDGDFSFSATGMKAASLRLALKSRPKSGVNFSSAEIGLLEDDEVSWPEKGDVRLEGFRYQRLHSTMSISQRMAWLRKATSNYSSQPYIQLASIYSLVGQENDARHVLLESTRRMHNSGNLLINLWGRLQDIAIGFGYKPGRALIAIAVLWASSSAWFQFGAQSCSRPGSNGPGLCPVKSGDHPTWDPWLYCLDLLIPIVNFGHKTAWDPTGFSKVVMYILVVAGWVFTTTIVAAAGRKLKRS
jgi:hypothetical protein